MPHFATALASGEGILTKTQQKNSTAMKVTRNQKQNSRTERHHPKQANTTKTLLLHEAGPTPNAAHAL